MGTPETSAAARYGALAGVLKCCHFATAVTMGVGRGAGCFVKRELVAEASVDVLSWSDGSTFVGVVPSQ
jgi:hypothetical protein